MFFKKDQYKYDKLENKKISKKSRRLKNKKHLIEFICKLSARVSQGFLVNLRIISIKA